MTDKFYDTSYDTGDRVIQCGRHNDIFKLWIQWRARGEKGFEARVDRFMELAQYQVKKINEMPDKFHLLMQPELVNVSKSNLARQLHNTHAKTFFRFVFGTFLRDSDTCRIRRRKKKNLRGFVQLSRRE